jgi:hypothetical protein
LNYFVVKEIIPSDICFQKLSETKEFMIDVVIRVQGFIEFNLLVFKKISIPALKFLNSSEKSDLIRLRNQKRDLRILLPLSVDQNH